MTSSVWATPAQKAGLKVGDMIRVLDEYGSYREGDIATFVKDDGSSNPWFLADKYEHAGSGRKAFNIVICKWEKVNVAAIETKMEVSVEATVVKAMKEIIQHVQEDYGVKITSVHPNWAVYMDGRGSLQSVEVTFNG